MMNADKLILITGSNGGIGASVARYLLRKGYRNLACHYHTKSDQIQAVLGEYDLNPGKHTFQADLTDELGLAAMREQIEERMGSVDCLANFVGGSSNAMSWKLEKLEFSRIININLTAIFLACKTFIPAMRSKNWGRIVNVSSILGSTGIAGASHYAAAKAAVEGLSRSLALELAKKNITCNVIALGYFDAGIIDQVPLAHLEQIVGNTPLDRLGSAANEVGGMVHYLMGPDAGFLTGQVLHVNGGLYSG